MSPHQGLAANPVKTPAEDFRLNLGALWTIDGADAIKIRSGIVWGQTPAGASGPCGVSTGTSSVTVYPGRVVIQGQATNQGAYVGTIDAPTTVTMAQAKTNPGNPASGQFKKGIVVIRVYDQLYDGGTQDGWDVEVYLGAPAATLNAAVTPAVPSNSLLLRNLSVTSAGVVTLSGNPIYTAPAGSPIPVQSTGGAPTSPWEGCTVWEYDTQLEKRWNTSGQWEIVGYRGASTSLPRISLFQTFTPGVQVETTVKFANVQKFGAIDQILSYDPATGQVAFKNRCRVRVEIEVPSDAPVTRWAQAKITPLPYGYYTYSATVEDRRTTIGSNY